MPAYEWMLEQRIERSILEEFVNRALRGIPRFL